MIGFTSGDGNSANAFRQHFVLVTCYEQWQYCNCKMHNIVFGILIFTAAAILFVPLFRKLNMGAILAYLFAGVSIGPHFLGLITDTKVILQFSELGVVFLLFVIGLELAPSRLWALRKAIFGLGLLQLIGSGFALALLAQLFGVGFSVSIIAGFGLALSSTAFSVQLLDENNQMNTAYGQGAFAILMLQDLAVVPLLALLSFMAASESAVFSILGALKSVGVVLAIVVLGPYVVRHSLRLIANSRTQEVFTAMALFIVLGTAVLLESIGLSMGMGAFLAGVLLANSEYRHELEVSLMPFKGLLLGLFFMAVGMSLDLPILTENLFSILGITAGFIFIKIAIVYLAAKLFKYPTESALSMAILLPQGGEFAFVLFNSALEKGIMDAQLTSLLNASVILSMAATPFLFYFNKRFLKKSSEISERPYDKIESTDEEVIIAGFGRFGQIVARVLRAQKIKFIILEHDATQVETARKFGSKVYYGDASRSDIIESAGANKIKTFVLAIDDVESSVATAKMIRHRFPHIEIIARARNRRHALELMELGVKSIHRETFLTSLAVAKETLLKMGLNSTDIDRRLEKFRAQDEMILQQQYEFRGDEEKFVSFTIEANKQLEQTLMADMKTEIKS